MVATQQDLMYSLKFSLAMLLLPVYTVDTHVYMSNYMKRNGISVSSLSVISKAFLPDTYSPSNMHAHSTGNQVEPEYQAHTVDLAAQLTRTRAKVPESATKCQ